MMASADAEAGRAIRPATREAGANGLTIQPIFHRPVAQELRQIGDRPPSRERPRSQIFAIEFQ